MAIINTTFGFIFVHVPKSAGTSVTSVLSSLSTPFDIEVGGSVFGEEIQGPYRKRYGISKHSTAKELRSIVGEVTWARMLSFGVVRHPVRRLESAFRFLRKSDAPWNGFRDEIMKFANFQDFVESDVWRTDQGPDQMFRPQTNWLADPSRGTLLVDRVCRVETLDEDLRGVLESAGVPRFRLRDTVPRLNSTADKMDERLELPPKLMDRLVDRYARDFEMFNYDTRI